MSRKATVNISIEVLRATCLLKRRQDGCDELATELGSEAAKRKLSLCDDQSVCQGGIPWQRLGEGCIEGVQNFGKEATDSLVNFWKKVKFSAAQSAAEADACDRDRAQKKRLYDDFNKTVPSIFAVAPPEGPYLDQTPCSEVAKKISGIYHGLQDSYVSRWKAFRQKNPQGATSKERMPADLQEFQSWLDTNSEQHKKNIEARLDAMKEAWNGVPALLNSIGVKISCYNAETQAEIACKAASALAASAIGGFAASKLLLKLVSEASGSLKVMKAVTAIEKGVEKGPSVKAAILESVGQLTDAQRQKLVKSLGLLDGKTPEESKKILDSVVKAHHICEDMSYGSYSKGCLLNKAKILREAGLNKQERDKLMRNGIAGSYRSPGEWMTFEDGRLPNPKLAITADEIVNRQLEKVATHETKIGEKNFGEADVKNFAQAHKELAEKVSDKTSKGNPFDTSELVTNHESVMLRAYGRQATSVAEDIFGELKRRIKEDPNYSKSQIAALVDSEAANLKRQADLLMKQARDEDNIVQYYRGNSLLETRKHLLSQADDSGITLKIDWEAADEDLETAKKAFINTSKSNQKWVNVLEKLP